MSDPYVPKPPSEAEVKRISEQQKYIHDDWTGDGACGAPDPAKDEAPDPEKKDP